jgi:hypothetical protein
LSPLRSLLLIEDLWLDYTESNQESQEFSYVLKRQLTASISHLRLVKVARAESTDIVHSARHAAATSRNLSLAGNVTVTVRIERVIATVVIENQEFIIRDAFEIRAAGIVIPVGSFCPELNAWLPAFHAVWRILWCGSQRDRGAPHFSLDLKSDLWLAHCRALYAAKCH